MANYSKFSPDFQGGRSFIMKIIFSSVSRLIFSYIKYILAVTMLSTIGTGVNADTNNEATYLK